MNAFGQKNTRRLVDCAMGRTSADLVIKNGNWVCVQTGEMIPNIDIAIIENRIAFVGADADHAIAENTKMIDATGNIWCRGLLDGHMHVESGMLTVTGICAGGFTKGHHSHVRRSP